MTLLNWDQGYSVNNALLDSQHERLFELLNRSYEFVMTAPEPSRVMPMIDELSEYTSYHFRDEEQYMQEIGYSELEAHIQKHREFTHTIEALRSRYHDNDLEVAKELIIILGEWLLCHVLKEDRKYAELPCTTAK